MDRKTAMAAEAPQDVETHEAFAAVLQLLARLFRFPADDATVAALRGLAEGGDDDLFMRDAEFARGLRSLVASFGGEDPATDKRAASDDFHKLFVGPLALRAAPWSTVYLDGGVLFGATEHEVRAEFHRWGFEIPEGTREPCDHIAYELQFLAEMHKRAAGMAPAGAGDPGSARSGEAQAVQEAQAFRTRFLDTWLEEFLAKVEAGARVGTYGGLAAMTRAALRLEEETRAAA